MFAKLAGHRLNRLIYCRLHARIVDCSTPEALVSFTFDDFPASALTIGGAILESFGWTGTYYTAMGLLGTDTECGRIADAAELRACAASGHEIANHTFSHLSCAATDFPTVLADVHRNTEALGALGSNDFSYPFGESNEPSMARLGRMFDSCRGIAPGINGEATDLNDLRANAVYSAGGMDRHLEAIERAAADGGWLIFYTHDVADGPSRFGCTPDDFRRLATRVAELGLAVKTVADALAAIRGATGMRAPAAGLERRPGRSAEFHDVLQPAPAESAP